MLGKLQTVIYRQITWRNNFYESLLNKSLALVPRQWVSRIEKQPRGRKQISLLTVAAVKYACVYWVDHLLDGWCGEDKYHSVDDDGYVDRFLRQKYLHWLEGLGILGCVPEGITAMLKLEGFLQVSKYSIPKIS